MARDRVRQLWRSDGWRRLLAAARAVVPVVLLGALVGFGAGSGAALLGRDHHVTVGNTDGTLSAVIAVDGHQVVIGGGSARADLADFVDRSTLPWHRQVDLLVVPTSDTADVAGAIGLIQHGTVRAVALLASPDDDPAWALLRDEATRHHVPLTVLTGRQQIALAPGSTLVLDAGIADDPSRPGPMAVLEDGTASVVFTDWPASLFSANVSPVTPPPGHVLVSLRPDTPFGTVHNQVLLRPEPTSTATVRPAAGTYVGDVAPGRPITLTLSGDQIRAPVGALTRVAG